MNFLENIFSRLSEAAGRPVLKEVRAGRLVSAMGGELLALIGLARAFMAENGFQKGDRCALLAHNSIRWTALDLAIMAEGGVAVPLYARQAPAELVVMLKDSAPVLVCCGDESLRKSIQSLWPEAPPLLLFDEVFSSARPAKEMSETPGALSDSDPVTIIYTSGTSGEAKGVVLSAGNLDHMLRCTTERLDQLRGTQPAPEQVFHYLPFCFAGSWILFLSCLSRHSTLTLSTDLTKLPEELALAAPQYFLNVPALLERVRKSVEDQLERHGGLAKALFGKAKSAFFRQQSGEVRFLDSLWLAFARALIFPAIRRKLGPKLKALICGSAPLVEETQLFFLMLGLPVLQVYGLTETTAICTMDLPGRIKPGWVGYAISGTEMKLSESGEILVRGPHIFPGYWKRPEETAKVLRDGWFHTGDQGERDAAGNWRISGRVKNLLILSSGHNIAPEPQEEMLRQSLAGAPQVMLVGNGRSHLAALVTGSVNPGQVEAAVAAFNARLPHYKQIHAFRVLPEPFSIENGLLTANGKLKRDAILARYQAEVEELYRR